MAWFRNVLLYWRTLRYIKFSQIFWRLWRKCHKCKVSFNIHAWQLNSIFSLWQVSILRPTIFFRQDQLVFLNQSVSLDQLWVKSQQQSKLWRYNLHYFEALLSDNPAQRIRGVELLQDWLLQFPPYSEDAWEPYPISLRIVNIIKCYLNGGRFSDAILKSLYLQARYLLVVPEYHLLGNHLFENAKALIFAGLFFKGEEPKKWFSIGFKILDREIPEQILEDGGHFERSPMYQVIILEGLLDLYNLFQSASVVFPGVWLEKIERMRYWLKVMTHPDGNISFFNDAALGVAVLPKHIELYATSLGLTKSIEPLDGVTHLKQTGYVRLQKGKAVVLLDCACIGPDYLPGHAHADTLSFEFSYGQQRIVVNSGTSSYQDAILRSWQRSTAAHSTVEVNKLNSSEVWGHFRVGRRAYPRHLNITAENDELIVQCGHDGYQGNAHCIHTRVWRLSSEYLSIEDTLSAPVPAIARYYFHPTVMESSLTMHATPKSEWQDSVYYPEFGKAIDNHVLTQVFMRNAKVRFEFESF